MIPVSLSVRNFLSYGEEVPLLDFTQFQVACLTGDNGHGKSALLDAVTYALWGEARKSHHERKPDAGLLRIGANEMRVEFCFELDEERYRVIRSFRKTRRTSIPQLELQVFDPAADQFRSLSEGASLTRTQQRIEQLLSMDYDTFINSAFIVQGRADEFTQKSARKRKEILAEILGLGRYDQLQNLARIHLQDQNQQSQEHQRRLQELEAQLADHDTYKQQLGETSAQLEELAEAVAADEKRLEVLREQRLEHAQIQRQLEELTREGERLGERLPLLEREQQHLQLQQQKDKEILAAEAAIQRDFETYQQLRAEVAQLDQKLQQVRELEAACSALENQITQARHEVEQRREKWHTRHQDLERRLEEFRSLLAQEQPIEARRSRLIDVRQQEQDLEQKRVRHEALQHERIGLRHAVDLERQNLANQREGLQTRTTSLRQHLEEWETLDSRIGELEREVAELEQRAGERERLREKGSTLRVQVKQEKKQIQRLEEEMEQAREKVRILRSSSQAECPLCGSQLDEAHRRQLDQEFARQEQEQADRLAHQRRVVQQLEADLEIMRVQYQHLDGQIASLEERKQEFAHLAARRAQLQESRNELRQLEEQVSTLAQNLEESRYAPEQQARLGQIDAELRQLDYRPEQHAQLREDLQELLPVETEHARLQDARSQMERILPELGEAREKHELAQQYLDEKLYARQEQQELSARRGRIAQLGYDSNAHQQRRHRIDELSDIVARREALIAAQQRRTATEEALGKNEAELTDLRQRLQKMDDRTRGLRQRLQKMDDLERQFDELETCLNQARTAKDQLLQRQGSLQTQCDRCVKLAEERKELRKQLRDAQREAWAYQQLRDAFGKDGIQALIIENAIPEIERETNAILSRLTDNRIQITIESLRDLKKGGTRETLDIKIADEVGERSYHLYSGGEAFRTNFALRIAISKVLAMRAGARLRTLIIDEGFGTQDSQGLEQLIETIQEISKDFDKVLVVTHLPNLKNAFPVQIEVTKHPDIGSRFQIINNA